MKLFLLLTFITIANSADDSYNWYGLKLQLPFSKKWLANEKARKNTRDPLVFFEKDKSPRIAGTLYHTNYDLNPKDYSAFEETFLKSKMEWLKKENSALEGKIITNSPESRGGKFSYQMTFNGTRGIFKEVGLFQRCQEKSFTLKVMIPKEKWDTKKGKEIIDFVLFKSPCPSPKN